MSGVRRWLLSAGLLYLPVCPLSCHTTEAYEDGSADRFGRFREGGLARSAAVAAVFSAAAGAAVAFLRPRVRDGIAVVAAGFLTAGALTMVVVRRRA